MDVAPSALAVARDLRAVDVETEISSRFPPLLLMMQLPVDERGQDGQLQGPLSSTHHGGLSLGFQLA